MMTIAPAWAHGTCFPGTQYGKQDGHNYVEFRVNMSARAWHIHQEWWMFPAELWTVPNRSGYARAGIHGTDLNPLYSPSSYKLCSG